MTIHMYPDSTDINYGGNATPNTFDVADYAPIIVVALDDHTVHYIARDEATPEDVLYYDPTRQTIAIDPIEGEWSNGVAT